MELIPIIKLSLTVFALIGGFVIILSYMIYKLRGGEKRPWLRKTLHSITRVRENTARIAEYHSPVTPAFAAIPSAHYSEQITQANYRHVQPVEARIQKAEKPRERFQIINNQQVELRKVNYYSSQVREFQPAPEQRTASRSFNKNNVLSSYASGNDSLQKMRMN